MRLSISIRTAILSIVALAATVMLGLVGLMLHSAQVRDANEAEIRLVESERQTLDALEIAFLQARRAEKDFLLRHDDRYVDRHAAVMAEIAQRIERAREIHGQLEASTAEDRDLQALSTAVAAYGAVFGELVASRRRLGFDEQSGLQGQLRKAVHEIEAGLETLDQPEMQVKMLMMRRHEKDFIMRGDPKYLDRLNARVDEFRAFPASHYSGPAQRAEIDRLLTAYQTSFAAFVEESLAEKQLRAALSARFAEAEPLLAAVDHAVAVRGEAILAEVAAASRQSRTNALILGLAGLGLFTTLALWLSFAIARPLRAVRTALQQMMAGDYSHPLPGTRITESAAISEAVETFRRDLSLKGKVDKEIAEVIAACAA